MSEQGKEFCKNGLTVIEASAGTGKTQCICRIVANELINGGLSPRDIAVVTFTNAAASELMSRIHGLLTSPVDCKNQSRVLDNCESENQKAALKSLGEATIGTIHSFCNVVLSSLGSWGAGGVRLVPNDRHIRNRSKNDALVSVLSDDEYGRTLAPAIVMNEDLVDEVSKKAIKCGVVTVDSESDATAMALGLLANTNKAEYQMGELLGSRVDNDSILRLVRDLCAHEQCARLLRDRFKLVVVDEFQDTDPVQWEMIRKGFVDMGKMSGNPSTVIVVGDPKQSIYGFRGADVANYSDAKMLARKLEEESPSRGMIRNLTVNFRSDPTLMSHTNYLVYGDGQSPALWMGEGICDMAQPSCNRTHDRLRDKDGFCSGTEWRYIECDHPKKSELIELSLDSLASVLRETIGKKTIVDENGDGNVIERLVEPLDCAVLVRTGYQANKVAEKLRSKRIPATVIKSSNVMESFAAEQLTMLVGALAYPTDSTMRKCVALGMFGNQTDVTSPCFDERWQEVVLTAQAGGFAAVWEGLRSGRLLPSEGSDLRSRILARTGGEGLWIDALQVAEILNHMYVRLGSYSALYEWARESAYAAASSDASQDNSLLGQRCRIKTDRPSVRVMTYWEAKGCEFPLVYLPFLANETQDPLKRPGREAGLVTSCYLDRNAAGQLHLFEPQGVDCLPSENDDCCFARKRMREAVDECGRVAYVALTRAKCRTVFWLWGTRTEDNSRYGYCWWDRKPFVTPLMARLLGINLKDLDACRGADEFGTTTCLYDKLSDSAYDYDNSGVHRILVESSPTKIGMLGPSDESKQTVEGETLERVIFRPSPNVSFDSGWRASFSALCAGKEPRENAVTRQETNRGGMNPMQSIDVAGTSFGTLVHAAFESAFTLARRKGSWGDERDLAAIVRRAVAEAMESHPLEGVDQDAFAAGVLEVMTTPLGGCLGSSSLMVFSPRKCRAELSFDLIMEAAEDNLGAFATLWKAHVPENDRFFGFDSNLESLASDEKPLSGIITGEIDLLACDGGGRYFVFDWKTNNLGLYDSASLDAAMFDHAYPLQALLYLVGLYRLLCVKTKALDKEARRRLWDKRVGGAYYLFVRGMRSVRPVECGAGDEDCLGVCFWKPPFELVDAIDGLLAGRVVR